MILQVLVFFSGVHFWGRIGLLAYSVCLNRVFVEEFLNKHTNLGDKDLTGLELRCDSSNHAILMQTCNLGDVYTAV